MIKKQYLLLLILISIINSQSITEILANNPNLIKKYQDTESSQEVSSFTAQITKDGLNKNALSSNTNTQANMINLKTTIDPDLYFIAPGDVIKIFIWGKHEANYTIEVNGEQSVLLPRCGVTSLKGKNLTEAKQIIIDQLSSIFKNDLKIEVILSKPGNFPVYISGEINEPASYAVNSATRLSDLVKIAKGITKDGSLRNIKITNKYSEQNIADLTTFYNSGKMTGNPFLKSGDVVFIMKKDELVRIEGAVTKPDRYQFMHGDKLSDIITCAGGLKSDADTSRIFVTSFVNNYDSIITQNIPFSDINNFSMQPGDRISINKIHNFRIDRGVFINGEVKYPGFYPIRKNQTTIKDIITQAGGLTENASLANSLMLRKQYTDAEDREFERIKTIPVRDLSPLESSYLKTKLVENEGVLSINFSKLFLNDNTPYNITLKDGDEINIAKLSKTVKVTGGVIRPGLVKYEEDKNVNYYISKVDGLNSRARKGSIMIIKGGTGVVLKPKKVNEIEPGDAIWVPERTYINKFNVSKDILLVMGAVATLIISAFTIQEFATK